MKLENCLLCCCHRESRTYYKCTAKNHKFSIAEKQAVKYNCDIKYIKSECRGGRHICASLGSAGYTYLDDIKMLANYAYNIGDRKFSKRILK